MEVQNYRGFFPIGKWGCYFCSLGKIAEDVTNKTLSDREVMEVYSESVFRGIMGWNCYIKHPDKVLELFLHTMGERGHRVTFIGHWNADMKTNIPIMDFGWEMEDVTHEVIRRESGEGYHFGLNNWNPWPELKCGARNGRRLFNVVLADEELAA